MKRRIQKNTMSVLIVLLGMSLMSNILYMNNTRILKERADHAVLMADSTLSAKLVVEKELHTMKARMGR